ncbi:hypothetical protein PIB30_068834 [Stylosanthes scabra]|uniref:Endonuclease/exonuclease/phosphatase domain-containing protein n=1 Tax=Stylosanthes scabra TaxID=79078 RepID=A0ABU6WMX3_9FABA|nr:hypothetical protein [Stylosanthes scabra]
MNILSWNCRGLAALATRELKDIRKKYRASLLFLTETRAGSSKYPRKRRQQWEEMARGCGDPGIPRLFIGDFNDVLSPEEKDGLHPKP